EILPAEHEGAVGESAPTPEVDQFIKFLFSENHRTWSIDIDNYEVPFQTDRKFVSTEEKYGFYTGLSLDKVLTVGYDNIVLKRFYHSPSKFIAGYNLSLDSDPSEIDEILEDKSHNTTFVYQWDVVAGEIVQTGMVFTKNLSTNLHKEYLIFYVDRQYDDSGRKISEEWKLKDSKKYQEEALTVFSQTLTY
ncbi:MAG: hypothetical protein JEY91_11595, partial [Spirochaetaceae bacterium]|nr:hypothetical protein [Spirochaetaceae bacterium]